MDASNIPSDIKIPKYVFKRNGELQPITPEKLEARIIRFCYGLNMDYINPKLITEKVISGLYNEVETSKIDSLLCETIAYMSTQHPDHSLLAGRLAMESLHKKTKSSFSETIKDLYEYVDFKTKQNASLISEPVYQCIKENSELFDATINYSRDFEYDYFAFKTLERSYLLKIHGNIVERPQHMLLRVSIGIHWNNINAAIETYNLMSNRFFTHASPTLFNSGTPNNQLSSCFLLTMKSDSMEGIYDTLKNCAMISKNAGGVGLSIHNIRGSGSYIKGSNGTSNGLIPMLKVFNDTARYVDQGGKRKGAFSIYLEPWHCDIFEFLDLKKNTGKEEIRARDLFYALWIPDLFMKRVETGGNWSLFCPNEAQGLSDVWGDEFEKLYQKYERDGLARRTIKAQELWFAILDSQVETGTPYMLYKDSCNRKSNQQNLGTIKGSNLCCEIIEYVSPDECAVCNLCSIALPRFVLEDGSFDFKKLYDITRVCTKNLNRIIDINYYPIPEAKLSNLKHRPIGIGIQGLADTFILMKIPFESDKARDLNIEIFETIYYASLVESNELAKQYGYYETFPGSPASKGLLQFDLWNIKPDSIRTKRWNWESLKASIIEHGIRNSLLVAPMPTASTAQILGNTESFEPKTSNIYNRRVLAGEFPVVNKHLVSDLVKLGLWNFQVINKIIADNGSIQNIDQIPYELKEIHKTVWEIKQRTLIDMAADRGAYIDQSQSFNVFIPQPTISKLTSMHFYGWKKGLKTGMYYLRGKPAADAIQFTVDMELLTNKNNNNNSTTTTTTTNQNDSDGPVCFKEEGCIVCGS